jgi:hypothetical protein
MLAWLHSSLASEQEFLVSLFGEDRNQQQQQQQQAQRSGSGGLAPPSSAAAAAAASEPGVPSSGGEGAPTIAQLLDQVFESVCRPLKVSRDRAMSRIDFALCLGFVCGAGQPESYGCLLLICAMLLSCIAHC